MNNLISKIINALLAIGALICFLAVDFVGYRGKCFTGIDYLDMETEELWPILYIIFPVMQIIIRSVLDKRNEAVISTMLMFIPIIATLFNVDPEYLQVGFYLYLIASIAMIGIATFTQYGIQEASTSAKDKKAQLKEEIRNNYDEKQLQEIINSPEMYNASLVEDCKKELEIRTDAEKIMPEARTYTREKIEEILSNQTTYSKALIYCCEMIKAERFDNWQKEDNIKAAEKEEEERKRIQQEKEEIRKRNIALWHKYKIYIYGTIAALAIILLLAYLFSDGRQYKKGSVAFENGDTQNAIKWLSKVGEDYRWYPAASYMLYKSFLEQKDSASAAKALTNATATENYDWNTNHNAYMEYVGHIVKGTFTPYIQQSIQNEEKAAELLAASEKSSLRIIAGEIFFKNENYAQAYDIFREEEGENSHYEKVASGYMGLYYLFGLHNVKKDITTAKQYLNDAPFCAPFFDYKLIMALSGIDKYTMYDQLEYIKNEILRFKKESNGFVNCDRIESIIKELLNNKAKYCKKDYWGFKGNWHDYYYDNGTYKGKYEGMNGSWSKKDRGAHNGWGCFVATKKETNDQWIQFGKYHKCNLQGDGLTIDIDFINEAIMLSYGEYENGDGKNTRGWDNSSIDNFSELKIKLPFVK